MIQLFKDLIEVNILPAFFALGIVAIAMVYIQKKRIEKYQRSIYVRMTNNYYYKLLKNKDKNKANDLFKSKVEPKLIRMAFDFFDAKLTDKENFDTNFINIYLS